jgi:hypothetical protein
MDDRASRLERMDRVLSPVRLAPDIVFGPDSHRSTHRVEDDGAPMNSNPSIHDLQAAANGVKHLTAEQLEELMATAMKGRRATTPCCSRSFTTGCAPRKAGI